MPQQPGITVLHDLDLGHYRLVLKSDQSIEVIQREDAPSILETVFCFDQCEAYRLMRALQELFQVGCE